MANNETYVTGSFPSYVAVAKLPGYRNLNGEPWVEGPESSTPEEAVELLEKEMAFRAQYIEKGKKHAK